MMNSVLVMVCTLDKYLVWSSCSHVGDNGVMNPPELLFSNRVFVSRRSLLVSHHTASAGLRSAVVVYLCRLASADFPH